MARLEILHVGGERLVVVTLSRRNLLALLHKLEMPGSRRTIENNDCYEDGVQTPWYPGEEEQTALPRTALVVSCEDDSEHYGRRPVGPGVMHPATERYVEAHGGAAGEVLSVELPGSALRRRSEDNEGGGKA